MISILLFMIIKRYLFDKNKLESNHKFTIAEVYQISYPVDGGPDADFIYCVNNKRYKDFTSINTYAHKIKKGDLFLLKYYPPDPKISRIILDKRLDSLRKSKTEVDICNLILQSNY